MAKSNGPKIAPEIKLPTEHDMEVEYLMRATGRSRVQVLNAIKVPVRRRRSAAESAFE